MAITSTARIANMRTTSPWWLSLLLGLGLLLLLVGHRLMPTGGAFHKVVTMGADVLVWACIAVRFYAWLRSRGERRAIERTLLWGYLGVGLALVLCALSLKSGPGWLGLADGASASRWAMALTVLWLIVMAAALIPITMVETTLGAARRGRFDFVADTAANGTVEHRRVREIALSGLSVALATGFLMTTCGVASERNVRKDVSYFRTSAPGESTRKIVSLQAQPISVLLFFPEVNEVKDEVEGYFQDLARATGKVSVETRDRLVDASLAQKYRVVKDGAVVLVRGDKSETIELDTDIQKARRQSGKLRKFDREVNSRLLKLVRERRKVYISVGHGELNDPESTDVLIKGRMPTRASTLLRRLLSELNYELKDLPPGDLARGVPDDATVVMVIAPTTPLSPQELISLDLYLQRGGRLFAAFDPIASMPLGALEGRLGLAFDNHVIASDDSRQYMPQTGSPADRKYLLTDQFSAHASTTSLSRAVRGGLLLIEAGSLVERPFDSGATGGALPKRTFVIKSGDKAFSDLNGDFTFNDQSEKRGKYNLAAAVEGHLGAPAAKGPDADADEAHGHGDHDDHSDHGGHGDDAHKPIDGDIAKPADAAPAATPQAPMDYRAFVVADGDLFADLVINNRGVVYTQMLGAPILDDAMKWLGGDEAFVGDVVDEDDKPLEHSKGEDTAWFLITIVGVPLVVFGIGMAVTRRRLGRRAASEVEA